jgi:aspartyl-tRNA(Asn)/glutamyl-tRNA(Gln) amidotransferase subunit B
MNNYQPIIGLEIHVELATKSKMFCQCDASWQKYEPNANTCPVCLGLPGALPVPNKMAVEYTIKIAQALGCTINKHSHFDRKHYFYPDLPKGYQISQYDEPIGINGSAKFKVQSSKGKVQEFETKEIRIHRVHLEEDTGKLIHLGQDSVMNFNRSSVPLVEIVTEADFRSSDEVKAFLHELHTIIRYLGVSEADMEKGSMRLEPNISVKAVQSTEYKVQSNNDKDGETSHHEPKRSGVLDSIQDPLPASASLGLLDPKDLPKFKVEVKNINSFNFVKKAVDYEVKRQGEMLDKGETPAQETRGWDEKKNVTVSQRTKEDAHDYRYFPDPDVPPMEFSDELLDSIRETISELPGAKVDRYVKDFGLKLSDAIQITREQETAKYFEQVISNIKNRISKQQIKDQKYSQIVANLIINKKISTDLPVEEFAERAIAMSKPKETDLGKLDEVVKQVISANEKSVADYKAGKTNALMFLVGQVMKEMRGKADANVAKAHLQELLYKTE